MGLSNLFLENWGALEGCTPLKRNQLSQMQATATALIRTLGERELMPGERAELNLLYRQVYTLAYTAYNELRDALAYTRRREKDVSSIAPSLHEDQGRRRSSGEQPALPDETDDGEEEVAAISARATALAAASAVPSTSGVAAAGGQPAVRAGFPGAASVLTDSDPR